MPVTWPPKPETVIELGSGGARQVDRARKTFAAEQIMGKLREAQVRLGQGETVAQSCRRLGVAEQTCYRWRKGYAG